MDCDDDFPFVDDYYHIESSIIYSPTCVPGRGSNLVELESQLSGCKCVVGDTCLSSSPCQISHICTQNYSAEKALLDSKWSNAAIVECNSQCTCCVENCSNRLVQFGPRKNLEVFIAGPVKGFGLRTREFIPKGAFICEYAGEVIGLEEAKDRFRAAEATGEMNFVFVLNERVGSSENSSIIQTIIDPTFIGNIGRYVNHSCDPNSGIVPVRVDSPVPKLGIFAKRNVCSGEEITYDYSGGSLMYQNYNSSNSLAKKPCVCGAHICRGSLPFDSSLQ